MTCYCHLPNKQGPEQVVFHLNKKSKLRLAQGKQKLRAACPKGKLKFKFVLSPEFFYLKELLNEITCTLVLYTQHLFSNVNCTYSMCCYFQVLQVSCKSPRDTCYSQVADFIIINIMLQLFVTNLK